MTTTFTAVSLQKQIRRDTKHEIFAFVEEDSVGTTKHFKSEVWKTFNFVKVVASGFIIPNLCCCHKCENVLSYNAKSCTSHLKRHVDACITKKVTGAMNQYLNKTVTLTNSDCGLTVSERRAKLSPTTVEAIEMVSMAFKKGLYK